MKQRGKKAYDWKSFLVVSVFAIALLFSVREIFFTEEKVKTTSINKTEKETALEELLSQIDGVGRVSVMIYEDEEGVKGVVVVCSGAKDIRVNSSIREAVSMALGTEEKYVRIYEMKN